MEDTWLLIPGAPAPGLAPGDEGSVWHTLSAGAVLSAEKVDEHSGLSSAEVASRTARFGPNKFDAGTAEPRWRAFLRQYADLMQIVLLVAGLVSLALQEWETGIVLIVLTLFNAVLGLQQEGKAAVAVAALQKMMIIKAKAMRDGQLQEIPAEQLVPGDIVSIEAGDIIPADGRLLRGDAGDRRAWRGRPRSPWTSSCCRWSWPPTRCSTAAS